MIANDPSLGLKPYFILWVKGGGGGDPYDEVPLVIGETFGEDLGPRHPTSSKPRPAQLLRPK